MSSCAQKWLRATVTMGFRQVRGSICSVAYVKLFVGFSPREDVCLDH